MTLTVSPHPNLLPAEERQLKNPSPLREKGRDEGERPDRKTTLHRTKPPLMRVARKLRRDQTEAEAKLWFHLRDRRLQGHKFRRQVPMLGYVLDFYCAERKLVVELDGGQHNEDEHLLRDEKRDAALQSLGISVLRFWNDQVFRDLDAVLAVIAQGCRSADEP